MSQQPETEEVWRKLLAGELTWERDRRFFRLIPGKQEHRCKNCNAPLQGIGAYAARLFGRGVYRRNPRFCNF